jgi:5-methyltetrahydrofolate--homocysteine methyltransferase
MAEERTLEILDTRAPLLLDGAYGTLIMGMGLPPGRPPDEWNLLRPRDIAALHERYIEAGAGIVLTNTFGSNTVKLAGSGLAGSARELNLSGARIAREAAGSRALVAGDMGPTGELLEPYGRLSAQEAKSCFREQARALYEGGVDLLMIETMYDLREALLALEAALDATPIPVFVCLTFEKKAKGFATIMGDRAPASLAALEHAGATAVGANCSLGTGDMRDLVTLMVDSTSLPVIAEPNAGEPHMKQGMLTYDAIPGEFADHMVQMVDIGARIVGGCCGTDPAFIGTLKLDERARSAAP